jgi:hypothetical protein
LPRHFEGHAGKLQPNLEASSDYDIIYTRGISLASADLQHPANFHLFYGQTLQPYTMAGKKGGAGDNSKKAQGQARKADAAAGKKAAKDREVDIVESSKWDEGSKDNSKK